MRRLAWASALLAAVTLTGITLLPEAGWVLKTQWAIALGLDLARREHQVVGDVGSRAQRLPLVQNAEPALAMASALVGEPDLITTVARRFPDNPAVCAARLRHLLSLWQTLSLDRKEDDALLQSKRAPNLAPPPVDGTPALVIPPSQPQLLELAHEALRGERLDPGNAFFPALHAYALFGLHQDTAALAALHGAALKPHYNDHTEVERRGRLLLLDHLYGKHTTIGDLVQDSTVLSGHISAHRQLARAALAQAIRREQAGHPAEGLAIRQDIRLLGACLRHEATTVSLVLNPLHQIAARFPHPLGPGASAEIAALEQATQEYELLKKANDQLQEERYWTGRAYRIGASWGWGIAFFILACLLLVIGALCKLLQRTAHAKTGSPALPGVRLGLWLMLGIGPLAFVGAISMEALPPLSASCWFALLAALLAALWPLQESRSPRVFGQAAATMGVLLGVFVVAVALLVGPLQVENTAMSLVQCYSDGSTGPTFSESRWYSAPQAARLAPFALGLPLFVMLVLAIVSRVRRVPITVGIVRGLPCVSVVLASLLLLGQAAFVLRTARLETALRHELWQEESNEGALLRTKAHMRRKQ